MQKLKQLFFRNWYWHEFDKSWMRTRCNWQPISLLKLNPNIIFK